MADLLQIASSGSFPAPPRPEDVEMKFSEKAVKELQALRTHYPTEKACILPALWIAQREYDGFLDSNALAEVAIRLNRSYAEIEGVATFYSMYNTQHKPGKHKIEVCTCLSCYLCGSYRIFDYLKSKLGIGNMETTPDGMFMLEEVECLDACDRAPLLQVGDQYHGPVDEAYVDRLLEELRGRPDSTVVRLADEVVQVHLADHERPEA